MNTFPNLSNKHDSDSIISPTDFISYLRDVKGLIIPKIPENVVLVYQGSLADYIESNSGFDESPELSEILGGRFFVSKDGKLGAITRFGIGSANASAVLEEMIELGAKRFFNVGTAGSLQVDGQVGDIVVCDRAIRDEGTSHHYLKSKKYSVPTLELTETFKESLRSKNIPFATGPTWTIDAPYRETIREAKQYQEEGVLTVEMEAAALFAVAEYRKVEIMAAFSISDLLGKFEWTPAFHDERRVRGLEQIFDTVVELLS